MNGETDGIRFSCCQGRWRAGDTRHCAQGQLVTAVLGDGEAETSAEPNLRPRTQIQTPKATLAHKSRPSPSPIPRRQTQPRPPNPTAPSPQSWPQIQTLEPTPIPIPKPDPHPNLAPAPAPLPTALLLCHCREEQGCGCTSRAHISHSGARRGLCSPAGGLGQEPGIRAHSCRALGCSAGLALSTAIRLRICAGHRLRVGYDYCDLRPGSPRVRGRPRAEGSWMPSATPRAAPPS